MTTATKLYDGWGRPLELLVLEDSDGNPRVPLVDSSGNLLAAPAQTCLWHLEHPFGKGTLTSTGVQWSAEVTTSDDSWTEVESVTIAPPQTGSIVEVEIAVTWAQKSSSTTKYAQGKLQARNQDGTWVDLTAAVQDAADASSYTEHTLSGRFTTTANFNAVPFDLRLVVQREDSGENANAKVKNSSYVAVKYSVD